jgi:hypothetical protein
MKCATERTRINAGGGGTQPLRPAGIARHEPSSDVQRAGGAGVAAAETLLNASCVPYGASWRL